jgi:thioredoxin reductase (NADPH)
MEDGVHDEAVARGLLRYCPVCDTYEITDRSIAVIGTGDRVISEAVFLRIFTDDITLISPEASHEITPDHRKQLEELGITTASGQPSGRNRRGLRRRLPNGQDLHQLFRSATSQMP